MKKFLYLLLALLAMLALAGCSSRSTPAGVTDANNMSGSNSTDANKAQTYAVSNDPDFQSEMAEGPHDGLLGDRSFYFGFNQYSLDQKYLPTLEAHAKYLLAHASECALLAGNTDTRGSRDYNLALGQKRANVVAQQLEHDGVPSAQIRTISYGAERPVALGHTEADHARNRRTDIIYEAC